MTALRFIPGVIFDMGDVLHDASGWRRWLFQELHNRGVFEEFDNMEVEWEGFLVEAHLGRESWDQAFRRFLNSLALSTRDAQAVFETSSTYRRSLPVIEPFGGVKTTLESLLSHGVRLAVLSDTERPAERVRQSLKDAGLSSLFRAVVTSVDIGIAKPAINAYLIACQYLDLLPSKCAFVGHESIEIDGAHNAGLTTIAFNASGLVGADYQVKAFGEIVNIVLGDEPDSD